MAGAPAQVLAAMAGDAEGVAALDAADASLATSLAVEEAEATKSVLGDAEDALAEALALAADEDEDDEAEAAEAEVEAEVKDEVSVSVSASAFPPASEWVGADEPSDEPSAAPSDFPGRLSRAMRTITDWFTGVPFLDLYEAPAPEMATMTAAEMHLAAEEHREMLARALRVVEIRPEASPSLSAVAVTPPRSEPSADAYGMNPVEEIPAPEPETLEEMDYESYLAFHGMEILEGTPPQVVAAMVGDLDAANRADAEDARRAERRAEARRKEAELASVDAALAALMAKKDVTDEALEAAANDAEARMMNERLRGEEEDDRTAGADRREYLDRSEDTGADAVLASELRAASAALAASEQRATELELSLAALAAEAEAAKAEASAHKRKLAAAYERGERVSELLAEVDRWKDAHDASESARAAYAEEQAERKRLFVAEADERLAEAKAQAERSDTERRRSRRRSRRPTRRWRRRSPKSRRTPRRSERRAWRPPRPRRTPRRPSRRPRRGSSRRRRAPPSSRGRWTKRTPRSGTSAPSSRAPNTPPARRRERRRRRAASPRKPGWPPRPPRCASP